MRDRIATRDRRAHYPSDMPGKSSGRSQRQTSVSRVQAADLAPDEINDLLAISAEVGSPPPPASSRLLSRRLVVSVSPPPDVIEQTAPRRVERIRYGDDRVVLSAGRGRAGDDDFSTGKRNIDPDVIRVA